MTSFTFDDGESGVQKVQNPFGGTGQVGSTMPGAVVRKDGDPAGAVVQLYALAGGAFVDQAVADSSGNWQITGLDVNKLFMARVRDPSGDLNGAVLDWIKPVPM